MDTRERKVQASAAEARAESRMTAAQREAWQLQCFGVTVEDLTAAMLAGIEHEVRLGMRRSRRSADDARESVAVSILSDAQAELSLGRFEQARQSMNRAKWILSDPDAIEAARSTWRIASAR